MFRVGQQCFAAMNQHRCIAEDLASRHFATGYVGPGRRLVNETLGISTNKKRISSNDSGIPRKPLDPPKKSQNSKRANHESVESKLFGVRLPGFGSKHRFSVPGDEDELTRNDYLSMLRDDKDRQAFEAQKAKIERNIQAAKEHSNDSGTVPTGVSKSFVVAEKTTPKNLPNPKLPTSRSTGSVPLPSDDTRGRQEGFQSRHSSNDKKDISGDNESVTSLDDLVKRAQFDNASRPMKSPQIKRRYESPTKGSIGNEASNSANRSVCKNKALARIKLLTKECTNSPEILNSLRAGDIYFLAVKELRASKTTNSYDVEKWETILAQIQRILESLPQRRIFPLFGKIAELEAFPDPSGTRRDLLGQMYKRMQPIVDRTITPEFLIMILVGSSKIRSPDITVLVPLLEAAIDMWPVLTTDRLIQAANAVAELGLSDHRYTEALKIVLCHRLAYFLGPQYRMVSSLSILSLLDDQRLFEYCEGCMKNWKYFVEGKSRPRELYIVELFLRLCRWDFFQNIPDEMRGFFEFLRTEQSLGKEVEATPYYFDGDPSTIHQMITRKALSSGAATNPCAENTSKSDLESCVSTIEGVECAFDVAIGPFNAALLVSESDGEKNSWCFDILSDKEKRCYYQDASDVCNSMQPPSRRENDPRQFLSPRTALRYHLLQTMGFNVIYSTAEEWNNLSVDWKRALLLSKMDRNSNLLNWTGSTGWK